MPLDIESLKNKLDESKWKRFESTEKALLNDGVIRRQIPDVAHAELPELIAHLQSYTSAKNGSTRRRLTSPPIRRPAPRLGQVPALDFGDVGRVLDRHDLAAGAAPEGRVLRHGGAGKRENEGSGFHGGPLGLIGWGMCGIVCA